MRFAYADPPYLGCGKLYADRHEGAMLWDHPSTHETLVRRLCDEFPLGRKPEVLLREVIQAWLDTKPHKHHRNLANKANQLSRFVKDRKVGEAVEVAREAVVAWSVNSSLLLRTDATPATNAREQGDALASATVNRRLAVLKGALTWYGREDLSRKIKLRRENNARTAHLTREQIAALVKQTPRASKVRAAMFLLAYSGLRPTELLEQPAYPKGSTSLLIKHGKNGKSRTVPLPSHAQRYLSALPLGMSYDQLYKQFVAARKAAGFGPEIIPYTLRHSYASMLINQGAGLKTVATLMGNSVEVCAKHYAHLYDQTLRDAVKKLR